MEEELLLIDGATGRAMAAAPQLLRRAGAGSTLEAELQQEMIEAVGAPCLELAALAEGIASSRREADAGAREVGARAVALATSPLPLIPHTTPTARYREMTRRYGATARSSLTCGFHVHVSIQSADEGVAVLDRIREWLPLVLALSANSPFWNGVDTGYASYRSDVWNRWPCSGPNPVFGDARSYRRHEQMLLESGTLLDAGMLYLDARLSRHHPTVEIRIADVCLREQDAVTVAGLCRALVESAAEEARRGIPPAGSDQRMLRLATWRAAMTGVRGDQVDPQTGECWTAETAFAILLRHVESALERAGDLARVSAGIREIVARGTGADWQREQLALRGSLADVAIGACRSSLMQSDGVSGARETALPVA